MNVMWCHGMCCGIKIRSYLHERMKRLMKEGILPSLPDNLGSCVECA